jgi:WD40 repeat protein
MPQIQLVAEVAGHADPAWSVAFNPARPLLASCSTDKTVRLYSYTLDDSTSASASGSDAFPSPNTPLPRFALQTSLPTDHSRTVRALAWAPGGRTLATASFDSTVAVWEEVEADDDEDGSGAREWECVTALEGHENECKSVAFSHDGALLASCSRDRSVWVWEGESTAVQ